MQRRRFLAALGATGVAALGATGVAALGLEGCWLEPHRLAVTTHRLGAPDAPIRAVHLPDLHLRSLGRLRETVASAVHYLAPDLILLTGDAVDRWDQLPLLDDFLGQLPSSATLIATLGNWEHWGGLDLAALGRLYERHGGTLLVNRSLLVERRGRRVRITGLDDSTAGLPNLDHALSGVAPEPVHLLMAHSPAYRDKATFGEHRFTAMLSGHTHGGQINLLGWRPALPPGSGRYVAGWYRDGDGLPPLYVSRGVGTSVVPVRLGAVPELAVFEV